MDTMPEPSSPTALIVGASRGLGLAMAIEFVRKGWRVVGTVRDSQPTELHDVANAQPGWVEIESADVTKPDQIAGLSERRSGTSVDILFVNAGTANPADGTTAETLDDEFARVMLTNVLGVMRAVEGLQDLVRPSGLIGVMSSGQGSIANNTTGRHGVYRASKAALNQCMRSYAARHADDQRAMVLMAPAWIRTALGGPNAPFGVEETIPQLVETLIAQQSAPGLRFLDRFGGAVPW